MSEPVRPEFDLPPPSPLLPYMRLMRIPNVFTAIADVAMGFLFVHQLSDVRQQWPSLVVLIAASALLYTAGMILNDVFDLEIDRQERPFRPLPSGQVSPAFAARLGSLMLLGGVLLGAAAGFVHRPNMAPEWRSGAVAALLAIAVLSYDGWLKNTFLGPVGMGLCRLLNVLLGMSAAGIAIPPDEAFLTYHTSSWIVACGIGLYITGVTWFARSEATQSNWWQLLLATVVIAAGITLLPLFTLWPHPEQPLRSDPKLPFLLFAVLSLPMLRRAVVAITDPEPVNVQAMVKHCIMSLIVLDAAVTVFASGPMQGLLIAALIAPTLLLGRWVYST